MQCVAILAAASLLCLQLSLQLQLCSVGHVCVQNPTSKVVACDEEAAVLPASLDGRGVVDAQHPWVLVQQRRRAAMCYGVLCCATGPPVRPLEMEVFVENGASSSRMHTGMCMQAQCCLQSTRTQLTLDWLLLEGKQRVCLSSLPPLPTLNVPDDKLRHTCVRAYHDHHHPRPRLTQQQTHTCGACQCMQSLLSSCTTCTVQEKRRASPACTMHSQHGPDAHATTHWQGKEPTAPIHTCTAQEKRRAPPVCNMRHVWHSQHGPEARATTKGKQPAAPI